MTDISWIAVLHSSGSWVPPPSSARAAAGPRFSWVGSWVGLGSRLVPRRRVWLLLCLGSGGLGPGLDRGFQCRLACF